MTKKKLPPTPKIDLERETRAVLERRDNDIRIIAEGHSTLVKGQGEIKSELETVKQAVMEVDAEVKKVEQKVEGIGRKLDTVINDHEARIDKLEAIR